MNNIINITDFFNPFMVFAGTPVTEKKLNEIIEEVQFEFLNDILGSVLYAELEEDEFTTTKWIEFRDGKIYDKDGNKITYKGIKKALVYRTFFFYANWSNEMLAENAFVQIEQKTSTQVIPWSKQIKAWNNAYNLIQDDFKDLSPTIYNYLIDTDGFDDLDYTVDNILNMAGI